MTALLRAELLKLRTVQLPFWLLVTTLALVALSVVATVLTAGLEGSPIALDDPDLLARAVASASGGNVLLVVLGILMLTQEFRFGTATPSFLTTPKRGQVVVAKLLAVSLTGALFAALSVLLALVLSVALIAVRDGSLQLDRGVAEVVAACFLVLLLYGPIGVGVGALIRNQIAAVVTALAWMFVVEQLLVALLPEVGRWTPGGATASVLQLGDLATSRGDLLPVWGGVLVLLAYAAAFSVAGARLTLQRDLT